MRIGAVLAIAAAICLTTRATSADEKAELETKIRLLETKIRALETKAAALLEAGQNEAALDVVIKAQKLRDRADALRPAEAPDRVRKATDRAEKRSDARQPKPKQPRMGSPRAKSAAAMAKTHLRRAKEALGKQQTMVALEHGRAALANLDRWARQLQARENRLKLAMKPAETDGNGQAEAAERRLMARLERLEMQVKKLRDILKRQAARPLRKPTGPQ